MSRCTRTRPMHLPARVIAALLLVLTALPARADPPRGTCFAVQPTMPADRPPASVRCAGAPRDYAGATVWLRLPLAPAQAAAPGVVLVHSTRFARMRLVTVGTDGRLTTSTVRQGDYGTLWRIGGQVALPIADRPAPPAAVWLAIDRLQSYALLRIRVEPATQATRQLELVSLLIGAALALLGVAAVYNLGLALSVGERFFLWHGLWAAAVLVWGLVWSQAALFVAPALAGTGASRLCTVLACLAILFATFSAATALAGTLRPGLARALRAGAVAVVATGLLADLPGTDLGILGTLLAALTLAILAGVAAALLLACRRGSRAARDLLIAWAVPMLTLGATELFDFDTSLLGGGAQIAVLFASAFQTLCLSALATRRLGDLRLERDAARASEAVQAELAERDPLTGLLNRRGFVRRCDEAFGSLRHVSFGLLLIDVDRFKSINDRYGHEVGDAVLTALGGKLRALEKRHRCLAGRLGGEEFVIGISGLARDALPDFAEHVRAVLGAADAPGAGDVPAATVSIGVAAGSGSGPFGKLYGKADRALYEAKADGRDRVVLDQSVWQVAAGQLHLPLDQPVA